MFETALKNGLILPECKRPDDAEKQDDPKFCKYHRVLEHSIKDCYVFKDWLERSLRKGEINLSDKVR